MESTAPNVIIKITVATPEACWFDGYALVVMRGVDAMFPNTK